MPSDRKLRRFIRQWCRRYPLPSDWVDDRANKQLRRSEARWLAPFEGAEWLKRRQVKALIEWRCGDETTRRELALAGIDGPASWGRMQRAIKGALQEKSPTEALDRLLSDKHGFTGWGPGMASTVLAACRPKAYVVADERALRTLSALGLLVPHSFEEFDRQDWWPYLRTCRELSALSGVPLRSVHHALRAAADEAPKLPARLGQGGT